MKTYKSSDLTHKRAEVLKEAKANGVIIQECNTNGDVRCEYVILPAESYKELTEGIEQLKNLLVQIKGDL
jgi:hypothetical protein